MKVVMLACLVGVLLVSDAKAQKCNPTDAAGALSDDKLVEALGQLGCKVPASVNLADTMNKLSSNLKNMNLEQLQQLPQLIQVVIARPPAELKPFFSLSAGELTALLPVVRNVAPDKLKVVMPLLAQQQEATVARMLAFLKGVSRPKLEQLAPLFGSITQSQIELMIKALNTLPAHALEKLTGMVGGLGPVVDVQVANQQHMGLTPVFSIGTGMGAGGVSFSTGAPVGLSLGAGKLVLGRRLLQSGCVPMLMAIEVGGALTNNADIGMAVCKFTPQKLVPVMVQILNVLNKQSTKTLANLPAFTALLASTRPEVFSAIAKVPRPALSALLSIEGVDPKVAVGQLKALAAQDRNTIDKLVYFTQQTPTNKVGMLIGLFARLSDQQAATMARLMNSLSHGQIVLSMQLLEKFNFGVDSIGQSIPDSSTRGSTFNIGPFVRVTVGSSGAAGLPFKLFG